VGGLPGDVVAGEAKKGFGVIPLALIGGVKGVTDEVIDGPQTGGSRVSRPGYLNRRGLPRQNLKAVVFAVAAEVDENIEGRTPEFLLQNIEGRTPEFLLQFVIAQTGDLPPLSGRGTVPEKVFIAPLRSLKQTVVKPSLSRSLSSSGARKIPTG
jgi:hypothetical protein